MSLKMNFYHLLIIYNSTNPHHKLTVTIFVIILMFLLHYIAVFIILCFAHRFIIYCLIMVIFILVMIILFDLFYQDYFFSTF